MKIKFGGMKFEKRENSEKNPKNPDSIYQRLQFDIMEYQTRDCSHRRSYSS